MTVMRCVDVVVHVLLCLKRKGRERSTQVCNSTSDIGHKPQIILCNALYERLIYSLYAQNPQFYAHNSRYMWIYRFATDFPDGFDYPINQFELD